MAIPRYQKTNVRETYQLKDAISHLGQLYQLFRQMGIVPVYFILSIFCSSMSILFNLLGIGLLIPLLQGVIRGDFTKVHDRLRIIPRLIKHFPEIFSNSTSIFCLLLGMILLAVIIKNTLNYIAGLTTGHQIRTSAARIRKLLIQRCLHFGKLYYDRSSLGPLTDIVTKGPEAFTGQLRSLQAFFSKILLLMGYSTIMVVISWQLFLSVIIILPVMHWMTAWVIDHMKAAAKRTDSARIDLIVKIFNAISCISLVKSSAAEKYEVDRLEKASQEELEGDYHSQKIELWIPAIQDLNTMVSLSIITVAITAFKLSMGPDHASKYLIFLLVARRAMPCFSAVNTFRLSLANISAILNRFWSMMSDEDKFVVPSGPRLLESFKDRIEIRNLHFSYRENVPVLQNLNLVIKKGGLTAIVGPTGAGKTTLINLLVRFYDVQPQTIFLDGIDIREYDIASLMQSMSLVSQEPMILNESLRANITYGLKREVTDEAIYQALEYGQLREWVKRLPEGLDTVVGERGVQMSGGEKQRLALTRAFIKKADIIILDEATSALDTKTERRIQDAMDEVIQGRTAIVIAHRLSTIVSADHLVVIEEGHVVEQGSFDELMAKRGIFYGYWDAQKNAKLTIASEITHNT